MKFATLSSGSTGNCVFLAHGGVRVLVDCGRSGKHIEAQLAKIGENPADINYILVTHEHIDHVRGVGVFSRRYNVPVFATNRTWAAMKKQGHIGEIAAAHQKEFASGEELMLGKIGARSFSIPHDAADPVGYRFVLGNKQAVVATDIGHISSDVEENIYGADVALLESNHDERMVETGSYPEHLKMRILGSRGHLSNRLAAGVAAKMAKSGTRHIILGHLSDENNNPGLAFEESALAVERVGAKIGEDVDIIVAHRHEATAVNF